MVQDNKKPSGQGSEGTKPQTPVPQKNSPQMVGKSGGADFASINAAGADASGEFVREERRNTDVASRVKKNEKQAVEQKMPAEKPTAKNPQPTKEEGKKEGKEEYVIPVLRTFHQDTRSIAQTKGGAELRTILAKEAEEKRDAQKEYLRNTKDIMKESAVLRDKYNNFNKKQSDNTNISKKAAAKKEVQDIDRKNITRVVSGATAFMKSVHGDTTKSQEESKKQPENKTPPPPKEKQKPPTPIAIPKEKQVPSAPIPTAVKKEIENAAKEPDKKTEEKTEGGGIFAKIRGRVLPKDVFTKERRESLQQQQQEVVEKQSIQDAWKDFKQKKKKLQEMGIQARDVRSYTATADEEVTNKPLQRQNMLLFVIVFFLLGGVLFAVIFLATSPTEEPPVTTDDTGILPVSDVLNSEKQVFVDTSNEETFSSEWQFITEKGEGQNMVTKYVPYKLVNEKELQINFQEFSRLFKLRLPVGLQNAFGNYYFVGNYLAEDGVYGIFIASVEKYGDAFVWMRSWEKDAMNAFSSVFPDFFQQSKTQNNTIESRIIDNQDVRMIQNRANQKELLYYFPNRSVLVFIAGDASIIPLINARIRAANTP